MLVLTWLLGCRVPPDEAPVTLNLPGQLVRAQIEVTDDGDLLTFQRRPMPITDAIVFFLFALLFPALAVIGGMAWSEKRAQATVIVVLVLGSDLWMIWVSRRVEVMTIDRTEQLVSLKYRLYIGMDLPITQRAFSEMSGIGVVIIPGEGATMIGLELTELDRTRHRMQLGNEGEQGDIPYAVALRDHTADAMGLEQVEETQRRWW
ncbi:MAG: hypothetical protein ACI8RZ_003293 [Myxococcota bacterium]|jgi:hypothetical protein